jgi:hypothetical protein
MSSAPSSVVVNLEHSHGDVEQMLGARFVQETAWFLTMVEKIPTDRYPINLTCPFTGETSHRYMESETQYLVSVAPRGHVLLDIRDRKSCPDMLEVHFQHIATLKPGERLLVFSSDVRVETIDFRQPVTLKVGGKEFDLKPEEHILIKGLAKATGRSFGFIRHEQTDPRIPLELDNMLSGNCLCKKPDLRIPQVAELVFQHES